jgi:beta-lactamase regulating signal transducer with metallopeptidase domain
MVVWWLIETSVSVALLAAVVAILCRALRCSPAVRHALWLIVLIKLLLPPVVRCPWGVFSLEESAFEAVQTSGALPSTIATAADAGGATLPWAAAELGLEGPVQSSQHVLENEGILPRERPALGGLHGGSQPRGAVTMRGGPSHWVWIVAWIEWGLVAAWLAATFLAALRQGVWIARTRRLSERGGEVPRWLAVEVDSLAARLGVRAPRLTVVPGIRSPLVWCWGKPRLLWPAALIKPADPAHWRGVLAHELAHLKRHDHYVAWIDLVAGWLWWWNPIYWYVRAQVHENAEQACDAWVVAVLPNSRRTYAEALVEVSEQVSQTRRLLPALGASSGAGRTFERRLTMILREQTACRLSWRGLIAVALLAAIAVPSWLLAQAPPTNKGGAPGSDKPGGAGKPQTSPWELNGQVASIDAAKSTISLAGKQLEATTLALAKSVRVILDDGTGDRFGFTEGKLADVTEGAPAILRLSPDQKEVIGIWVEGPSLKGTLKAVDAASHSLTLSITPSKGEPEQDKTFAVAKTAKVAIFEANVKDLKGKDKSQVQPEKLADLPIGAAVVVKLSADQKTAGRVQVEIPSVQGVLKAVDAAKGTLSLQIGTNKGQPPMERTYAVAKNVKVTFDGAEGKLAELPLDSMVIVGLSIDQKFVSSIHAEGGSAQGVITAIDPAKGTLALRIAKKGEPAEEHAYDVAKHVKVTLDGAGAKLSDLPTGAVVTVKLSLKEKLVLSVQAEGTTVHGQVKVLDASGRGITIAEKGGERTLTVAKDASITVDGKQAQLSDVPAEAVVFAKLSVDQQTVRSLSAQGSNVQGIVRAVDEVNNEIMIELPKQGEAKYKLADDVRIGASATAKSGKLTDLKVDQKVTLQLRADQKVVLRIVVAEE